MYSHIYKSVYRIHYNSDAKGQKSNCEDIADIFPYIRVKSPTPIIFIPNSIEELIIMYKVNHKASGAEIVQSLRIFNFDSLKQFKKKNCI